MSTITADPNMLSVLSQVNGVTEIRDASGKLVGIFTPKSKTDEDIKKLFDLEKARVRLATEKARPFREMIDNLENLAKKKG